MDFFYYLVTNSKDWETIFHKNYFSDGVGFTWGVIGALAIAALCAIIFYFGCCNSKNTCKLANLSVWAIFLVVAGALGYFYADTVLIGDANPKSTFYAHSFYKANEDCYIAAIKAGKTDTELHDMAQKKDQIKSNLKNGKDVRFEFDITTAVLAILFFFVFSLVVKRFTVNGKAIPFLKP